MEKDTLKAKTKLILVTGGARSGKSAFAEEYALAAAPEGKDLGDLDHEYKAETADEAVDKAVELLPE
jgi:adenosyl cobinamide kinase/adenosyl cobinamide phosphate guanylyltransferase